MLTENKKDTLEETNKNIEDKSLTEKEKSVEKTSVELPNDIDGDIDLSVTRKKRFRINGDNNYILELDTSDMSIINRLDNLYPKLEQLSKDAAIQQVDRDLAEEDDNKTFSDISQTLRKIDMQMRNILDEIFDSNVSEVCAPSGSMFDPFNGEYRFEHIIDAITKLYENNINSEFKKMSERMKKHTDKYTKKKLKRR